MNIKRILLFLIIFSNNLFLANIIYVNDSLMVVARWNQLQHLINSNNFKKAYKIILPSIREEFVRDDSTLESFGKNADSLKIKGIYKIGDDWKICLFRYFNTGTVYNEYYFVKHGNEFFITTPWDILTCNWNKEESEHFIYYYSARQKEKKYGLISPTQFAMNVVEDHFRWYCNILNIGPDIKKIKIIMASSPEEVGELIGTNQRFEGVSDPRFNLIICILPFGVFHELGHILLYYSTGSGFLKCPALQHGLEEYGDGNGGSWKNHTSIYWTREELKKNSNFSIDSIQGAPESTALTKYLIEELGAKNYRELIKRVTHSNVSFDQAVKDVYLIDVMELDKRWKGWVEKQNDCLTINPTEEIESRIILDTFNRKNWGQLTIYWDYNKEMPTAHEIERVSNELSKHYERIGEPVPNRITWYLLNDENRMRELFGIKGNLHLDKNVIASTSADFHFPN